MMDGNSREELDYYLRLEWKSKSDWDWVSPVKILSLSSYYSVDVEVPI
jgi:hypothetical protein